MVRPLVGEAGKHPCATRAIRSTATLGSRAGGARHVRRTSIGSSRSGCLRKASRQERHGMRYVKAERTAHGKTATTFGTATRSAGKRFPKVSVAGG